MKKLNAFLAAAWRLSPSYILVLVLDSLVNATRILSNVILPKFLIDELIGAKNVTYLLLWSAAIVLANVLFTLIANILKRTLEIKKQYVSTQFQRELARKIMNVEYKHLEDPYYLDLKERAQFAVLNYGSLEELINVVAVLLKSTVTVIGLIAVMFFLSWLFVVILLVTVGIMIFIHAKFAKYEVSFFESLIPVNRKYGYYVSCSMEDRAQKDYRLYDMSDMLGDRVSMYNKQIGRWFGELKFKEAIFTGWYQVITVLQTALAYGYVGLRCIGENFGTRIGIGSLTMYVNAAINFSSAFMSLGDSLVSTNQYLNYLDPFMELMSLPNESQIGGTKKLDGEIKSVRFEHISFSYPNCDRMVLNDISFEIEQGQKISIVGLNGAGKSTLVKLLCRLYRPTKGTIYINDIDIFDYAYESYLEKISAVFQDYKLYNFTVEENITCKRAGEDTQNALDIIEHVGLKGCIDKLPNGICTLLGKAYDNTGVELSGGESQKIAIARALYKNADLIVLDEPTSALDPLSEAEIYEQFNKLVGKKTAIYISHRMSSSVFCDKVLIIDGGMVDNFDTHINLMKNTNSLYYKMFTAQAVNYQM